MKSYFDMLGLPPTATPEQITTQYEFLTHLYHPEHFSNPTEKTYAKRKCIALTAAYHALIGIESDLARQQEDKLSPPRVEPTLIDWGIIRQGTQLSARVWIHPGSLTQKISLTIVDNVRWLAIDRNGQINVENEEPLVFEVVANTKLLTIRRQYSGQIKVHIDAVTMYVFLMVQIAPALSVSIADDHRFSITALYSSFHPCSLR